MSLLKKVCRIGGFLFVGLAGFMLVAGTVIGIFGNQGFSLLGFLTALAATIPAMIGYPLLWASDYFKETSQPVG